MRFFAALIVLVVAGWLAWLAASFVWGGLTSLEPAILSPLLLASGTVIGVVVTVVGGQALQRRAATEEAHRPHKIEIYQRYMKEWGEVLQLGRAKEKRSPSAVVGPDVIDYLAQFTREVILWGSDGVLREYSQFMQAARGVEGMAHGQEAVFSFEKSLLEMRKDLGHTNRGIKQGDILRLFVTDIDSVLAERKGRR